MPTAITYLVVNAKVKVSNHNNNLGFIFKGKSMSIEENRLQVLKDVLGMVNEDSVMVHTSNLVQGQMVSAGFVFPDNPLSRVGYVTQVRKGVAQFGSDLVFLRLANGRLITHENQGFWKLNEEQEALARSVFEKLPEDEDYTQGYTCVNKVHEIGFLIENSESIPSPNTSNLTLTVKHKDKIEHISFI